MQIITVTSPCYRDCRLLGDILDHYIHSCGDAHTKVIKRGDSMIYDFGVVELHIINILQLVRRFECELESAKDYWREWDKEDFSI